MSDIEVGVKPDGWILLSEAAKEIGMSPNGVRLGFWNHPLIKEKHYKVMRLPGAMDRHAYVTREGVALLNFRKAAFKGNQYVEKAKEGEASSALATAQDQTALAMAEVARENVTLKTVLMRRVEELEAIIKTRPTLQSPGLMLPAPIEEVPELTKGDEIRRRITLYLNERHGESSGKHFKNAWNRLYQELYWRHSVSVNARKKEGETGLEVCERLGLMDKLYALACYLFPTSNDSL